MKGMSQNHYVINQSVKNHARVYLLKLHKSLIELINNSTSLNVQFANERSSQIIIDDSQTIDLIASEMQLTVITIL